MANTPIIKDIVLVGGGHSHALFISQWATKSINGVRVTLISPDILTPYSGMLPGLIAGKYSFKDTHIDLAILCQTSGVRFIQDSAIGLSPKSNQVLLERSANLTYDIISFDTGATPEINAAGARTHCIPVKPIALFYQKWQQLAQKIETLPAHQTHTISVVGNGAGGVELILAMQSYLQQYTHPHLQFQLIARGHEILSGYPKKLQKKLQRIFKERNIRFISDCPVDRVQAKTETARFEIISDQSNTILESHSIFWCTGVQGAAWLKNTDLALSEKGFIRVRPTLQTMQYDNVFAAGDVCHFDQSPLPKAGVYAVRMADTLLHNISEYVLKLSDSVTEDQLKRKLTDYKPQREFLSLLALGDETALGCKLGMTFHGRWVWKLKDRIDCNFMAMVNNTQP